MRTRFSLLTLLLLWCAAHAPAAESTPREVTVDDYFTLAYPTEVAIAPAGDRVAYLEGRWQESTNDRRWDIWVAPVDGGEPQRLTTERSFYGAIAWSPDRASIYFTWGREQPGAKQPPLDGKRQVWRIAADGGEPVAITQVPGGIDQYQLAADGAAVYYTTSAESLAGPWTALRKEFSGVRYAGGKAPKAQLWKLDLQSWRANKLLDFDGVIDGFAVSPDGKRIALVTGPDGKVATLEGQSQITIADASTGKSSNLPDKLWRADAPSPYARLFSPHWSSDSLALAFVATFDAYPSEIYVAQWSAEGEPRIHELQRPEDVSLDASVSSGVDMQWRGDSHDLCFLGANQGRVRVYCALDATAEQLGGYETLTQGNIVVDSFSVDRAGRRTAALAASPTEMIDVHLFEKGSGRRLTDINPHVSEWKLPELSVFRWKGANGDEVQGILELPPDRERGKPLPVIVQLHGGPTWAVPYAMQYGYHGGVLFASRGYAFFSPNYRGSTGYGDKFITELVGRENDIEVEDILTGVDALVKAGVADPDRLAIAGWSNGGYLTNCCIARTDRFKAASSGAGIIDQTLEWGTNDEPAYPVVFVGGPPWQFPDEYRRISPIFSFGGVKTPTLFHVGERDERCPKGNCEMAYRALTEYLGTPAELLVYPGEGHGLSRYDSRKAKFTWELKWFDHYLRGQEAP